MKNPPLLLLICSVSSCPSENLTIFFQSHLEVVLCSGCCPSLYCIRNNSRYYVLKWSGVSGVYCTA